MATTDTAYDADLVRSGSYGSALNSARAGFLPVPLGHVPVGALERIAVYLRTVNREGKGVPESAFTLYRSENVPFTAEDRLRLIEHGVKFIYVRIADQKRLREQIEDELQETVNDPSLAVAETSAIVYETSVELMNELLSEPDLDAKSARLDNLSRAIATLVINDRSAFAHLFAASHHDFYTATHMVNVATWMVPLAYALGHTDPKDLNQICKAGLLHDIGKLYIPDGVLNKPGKLSDEDWVYIRSHPERGRDHLSKYDAIDPIIVTVTLQHHERMDGSGYPFKLKGDQLHEISRICAVVDSFDAMTAFRPFKEHTTPVAKALEILQKETPAKYDPRVVKAWIGLLEAADKSPARPEPPVQITAHHADRRRHVRSFFHCPARVHSMMRYADQWHERPGLQVIAHNLSRSGVGFLSQQPLEMGEFVRVYFQLRTAWSRKYLEGRIVRIRQYQDGWYDIGVQLASLRSEMVDPEELVAGINAFGEGI